MSPTAFLQPSAGLGTGIAQRGSLCHFAMDFPFWRCRRGGKERRGFCPLLSPAPGRPRCQERRAGLWREGCLSPVPPLPPGLAASPEVAARREDTRPVLPPPPGSPQPPSPHPSPALLPTVPPGQPRRSRGGGRWLPGLGGRRDTCCHRAPPRAHPLRSRSLLPRLLSLPPAAAAEPPPPPPRTSRDRRRPP